MLLDRRDSAGNLPRTVPVHLLLTAKRSVFDLSLLLATAALYALNSLLLKPAFVGTTPGVFFGGYFNDILGGAAFLAYSNALICLYDPRKRLRRFPPALAYIACCGLFWEFVGPFLVEDSTTDLLDLVAYVFGAVLYCALARACSSSRLRSVSSAGPEKRHIE